MAESDENKIRKVPAPPVNPEETRQALLNNPLPILEQDVEGEVSYMYYGHTNAGRLLAVVVTEDGGVRQVVMACDLNPDQQSDYLERRARLGEKSRTGKPPA